MTPPVTVTDSHRALARTIMYGAAVGILGGFALFAVLVATACASTAPTPAATRHASTVTATPHRAVCSKPAPTTSADYTAMFAHTPLNQWGGGDTAITVTLGARHVWLFSDTLSTGRFVHSTAITQTGGCLHVSHQGAQLLPDYPGGWYWITTATRYGPSTLRIKAEQVHSTGTGPWDFAAGRSRYAIVTVSATGDATFTRWLPGTVTSDKPRGVLARIGPHHVTYGGFVHRDIRLANGQYLTTLCQNWDDGVFHPLRQYAPLFLS